MLLFDATVYTLEKVKSLIDGLLKAFNFCQSVLPFILVIHALEMVPAFTAIALKHVHVMLTHFLGTKPLAPAVIQILQESVIGDIVNLYFLEDQLCIFLWVTRMFLLHGWSLYRRRFFPDNLLPLWLDFLTLIVIFVVIIV